MNKKMLFVHESGTTALLEVLEARVVNGPGRTPLTIELVAYDDDSGEAFTLSLGRDGRWYDDADDAYIVKEVQS